MQYITKQGRRKVKAEAFEFWLKVGTDYLGGATPTEISRKYINPKTGKHYSRQHIHWIINRLNEMRAE